MNIHPSPRRACAGQRCTRWLVQTASLLSLTAFLLGGALGVHAAATPPDQMSYQGFLVDGSGNPLAPSTPANYTVVFRIYDDAEAGNLVWSEQQVVTVDKGNFSVVLGEGSAFSSEPHGSLSQAFSSNTASSRHLGITVTIGGSPLTLAPRLRLLPSPYAFLATQATKLVNPSTGAAFLTESGGNVNVTGTVNATTIAGGSITASGGMGIQGANVFEFGVGVSGKEANAGKIGYHVFTPGALDVVGAGTSGGNRRIKFWNEGGADFTGPATVSGTVTASTFVGNGTIPIGGIIMWSGAVNSIPAGWALCNGQTVNGHQTPNLLDRFIVGAGSGYGVGATGGAAQVTLTVAQMPAHNHGYDDVYFSECCGPLGNQGWYGSGDSDHDNGPHTTFRGTHNTGGGQPFENRPPYYALAFIMRVQ